MREFWHELEAATNARQAALFEALNRQLERLARRIEATVGDALDVTLEPAALAIAPPTPEQFHADLRELFSAGALARVSQSCRARVSGVHACCCGTCAALAQAVPCRPARLISCGCVC